MHAITSIVFARNGQCRDFCLETSEPLIALAHAIACLRQSDEGHLDIEWEDGSAVMFEVRTGDKAVVEIYNGPIRSKVNNRLMVSKMLEALASKPCIETVEDYFAK